MKKFNDLYLKIIKGIVFVICMFGTHTGHGQLRGYTEDTYQGKNFFGLNAGGTLIYGDLDNFPVSSMLCLNYGRNISSKYTVGIEVSRGVMESKNSANSWTSGLTSISNFTASSIYLKHTWNNIFKTKFTKFEETKCRIYVATGFGNIINDFSSITTHLRPNESYKVHWYKQHNTALYIPFNIGLDYKLPNTSIFKNAVLNYNFQMSYAFSDYIDGYRLIGLKNQNNDIFFLISVGLHFYFGKFDSH